MNTTETTEYRGHTISHTYQDGTLDITIHNPGNKSKQDLGNTAYWFAYSHLGTGTNHTSIGVDHNEDGTATVHYRY
jgi:hypothetical protein